VAIICRNTTEAINHLAYRLRLAADDVVVTTVVEHHANLLPWARLCLRRFVECGPDSTFTAGDVATALDVGSRPRLLAVTGASNVTGWLPAVDEIIAAAHERGVPRWSTPPRSQRIDPLPAAADFLAWSGHKMHAFWRRRVGGPAGGIRCG
jgi:selenocysteine lyase/cysteine desulfurase